MLSLATFSASPRSFPISSTTGETMWHGTHHSAQKSTRTGVSDPNTVVWKSASPTEPMFAIVCAPSGSVPSCAHAPLARRYQVLRTYRSAGTFPQGPPQPGPSLARVVFLGEEPL